MPSRLRAQDVKQGLVCQRVGRAVHCHGRVTSTNDLAKALAQAGAADGTVVTAEEQTAGRGRRGRSWLSPAGTGLLLSVILRPQLAPALAVRLTMLAALATCEAIRQTTGLEPALKWPNDVLILGKKVAGVLTETETRGDRLTYAVVGIGLNINATAEQLAAVSDQAISLRMATGRRVSRLRLLRCLLTEMDVRYSALQQDGGQAIQDEWQSRLETLGQSVVVAAGEETIAGRAAAVDADGALLVRCADGSLRRVLA